ncbi:MAG TPA: SprT-like domain-containing protein [Thermodesulfovibrionales bacterium]|nr:SprT-like domain-containing protein [Thermodesulfovibrionales bacterium]
MPLSNTPISLKNYFERVTSSIVSLAITDNSTSMLSVRKKGDAISVRLHRIFLDARHDVIDEIAVFIKRRKGSTPLLRRFVKENLIRVRNAPPKRVKINTQGNYHNLGEIYDSLNRDYFQEKLSCPITWGTGRARYAVRKRTLGSYSRHANIIRINTTLDRKHVPRYFIEFVIYHEMLHADMDPTVKNGRNIVHSREFRGREKQFRDYERALKWEKKKI